ncbi:MAG: hypothetical protein LBO74_08850 [Candidatus Symbiothrix sp.]|jgi:hypothetical protein|nr:hypothetical protein [Candidatus Symbiothrix sp.]
MKLRLILGVLICIIIASCNRHASFAIIDKVILSYDSVSSTLVDVKFREDSLSIERMREDSLTIIRYLVGGDFYHTTYSLKNEMFYENRIVPHEIIEGIIETSVILIPTFSLKDTIFDYEPAEDFTSFFVRDLSFDKSNYQIEKTNNEFITIKQSLVDTTYQEIYYYDQNFNIYKYINTWKDNKCVYVKKE